MRLNNHCLTSVAVSHNARPCGQCRPRCMGWLLILSAFIAMHVQMVRNFIKDKHMYKAKDKRTPTPTNAHAEFRPQAAQ